MLSWKNLCLGAALTASPLLMADEARGDHYRHGHYRPGCDVSRYAPSDHSSYRSGFNSGYRYRAGYGTGYGASIGFGYTPRVDARPPFPRPYGVRTPHGMTSGFSRYGARYPGYGVGYPRYSTGGFSLYIGR